MPPKKQKTSPRIDTFFTPQVLAAPSSVDDVDRQMVSLNAEQTAILREVVDERKNLFFTGSAGTGKSLLLRAIIAALRRKHAKKPDAVSVTASTGMAASNIGGMTLHAWGAISPTRTDFDFQLACIRKCKPALERWKKTEVLVIDEVSMVDGPLFTKVDRIARVLRKKTDRPFGGIQLVITGDFFQLPPVTKEGSAVFAFESEAWTRSIERTVSLSQVFRQKDDEFVALLNELRLGTVTPAACATFRRLARPLPPDPMGLLPTELFPLRREVDSANAARLSALPSDPVSFFSRDTGRAPEPQRSKLLEHMMAPRQLDLKVGAQVMLIKNLDQKLVNGSVGKVLGFWPATAVRGTRTKTGPVRDVRLRADGQAPVLEEEESGDLYPLVVFPEGSEAVLVLCDEFRMEDNQGTVLARRVQLPLILAWAISIHKSQGQTIARVKIDLGRIFEKGQSYVALSRAASMDGLQVLRFHPSKVNAHPTVVKWNDVTRNDT